MKWLSAKVRGFDALPQEDRTEIVNFLFLWSLFEARIMDTFARADLILAKVDEWREAGTLDADQYDAELEYFRDRYYAEGEFTYHFANLHLPPRDHLDLVRSVLERSNNDSRDRLLTVILIVWRFRNNLFHGEKWSYQLQGQLRNFLNANAILMRLLDQHGELAG